MKARFNFYYNNTPISKQNFESGIEMDFEEWSDLLDEHFNFSHGHYRAMLAEDEILVDVNDFYINEYLSGYYSINGTVFNQELVVLGGDSANEDDYNKGYFSDILDRWDGRLIVDQGKFKIDLD